MFVDMADFFFVNVPVELLAESVLQAMHGVKCVLIVNFIICLIVCDFHIGFVIDCLVVDNGLLFDCCVRFFIYHGCFIVDYSNLATGTRNFGVVYYDVLYFTLIFPVVSIVEINV